MSAAPQSPTRFDETAWFKSTASAAQNECVEVNTTGTGSFVGLRDSKDAAAGVVTVTAVPFTAFVSALGAGRL
ncbi:hypothetical protein GCM10010363_60500 [Streptomyces omiyaensis]|uniref:DUF397 domain-containing protein n=1 Tax=Streptomyces omiyaensis TaxID=68247 RepID=UPI00167272C4|nr:DUF397 domain-containing protein [Streptomyces omiyaensis]GGY71204.1 hypothetical protein GCM10010363_60500 [Streptomyces omiyaensis]